LGQERASKHREKAMKIDGQCHCGLVTYEAEIDPKQVSICHCTDCQALTGSPYRVTAICSAEQIRITGQAPSIYPKTGDNGRTRFQHFCGRCRFGAVHQRRGRPAGLGYPVGQHPPACKPDTDAANLVPFGSTLDQ
jgi:hypothetical protein